MRHNLKTDPEPFQAVVDGVKTHEVRLNDRNFEVGDELLLQETKHTGLEIMAGMPVIYTGREMLVEVTHILRGPFYGLLDDYVIISVCDVSKKYEDFYSSTACLYAEGVEFMTKEQIYEAVKINIRRTADGKPLVR